MPSVPRAGHQRYTGEERCLCQASHESYDTEPYAGLDSRHANRANTPDDHHAWQKKTRADFGQPQISRQLTDEIPDVKGRDACVPDSIAHTKIGLQACKTGVGDVDTIEVAAGCERETLWSVESLLL